MRTRETELGLGSIRIEDDQLNLKSRDDIPALLLGLQAIHGAEDTRERLFELLEQKVAPTVLRCATTGHEVVRKKPGAPLHGRVDSFVVETDVRHPTDVSLLWDAVRTALGATVQLARTQELTGWWQHRHWRMKLQRRFHAVRRKRGWTQKALVRPYLRLCTELLARMQARRDTLPTPATAVLDERLAQATVLVDQIARRLLDGETIPAADKLYSVFEPHTRWIAEGKAKASVELGVPAPILADEHGFVLGVQLQWDGGDVTVAVPLVEACQATYPALEACSFDLGFHSPDNRV